MSKRHIKRIVDKDLDLVYKKVGSIEEYVNSNRNIILRQLMAKHLVEEIFEKKKTVINFDESHFCDTTSKAYSYAFRGRKVYRTYKKTLVSVNLFLCVIDDGSKIF